MNGSDPGPKKAALTEISTARETARMRKVWTPPAGWVCGVATALGLFSALQAYRLTLVNMSPGEALDASFAGKLIVLNLALWYIAAAMMPAVVRVARQFPLDAA